MTLQKMLSLPSVSTSRPRAVSSPPPPGGIGHRSLGHLPRLSQIPARLCLRSWAGAGLLASSPLLPCIGHSGNWIEIAYGTSSGMVRVIVQHPETVGSGPQLFQTFAVHRSPVTKVMLSEKHLISGTGFEEEGQMGEASQGSSPSFFLPPPPPSLC